MCDTGVSPTYLLHVWYYRCDTGVSPTYLLHVWYYRCDTGVSPTYLLHVWYYMCNAFVPDTCVIHMFNTFDAPKSTTHVLQVSHNWPCNISLRGHSLNVHALSNII